jgi:hypothetical protein
MRGSAARGVLSGVVAGAGAWVAHTLSGGEVTPLAGLVAFALSVALGPVLLAPRTSPRGRRAPSPRGRRAPGTGRQHGAPAAAPMAADPLRVAALMLLAQGVWHLVFMVGAPAPGSASTSPAGAEHTAVMLAAHAVAAVAALAVAVGLDRALVRAVLRLAATLLPRPVVEATPLPLPTRPAPARTAAPPPLTSARLLLTRVLRGPPAGVPSAPA